MKPKCDEPHSSFAFNFNLRCYTVVLSAQEYLPLSMDEYEEACLEFRRSRCWQIEWGS
jgi:hypothetical protein